MLSRELILALALANSINASPFNTARTDLGIIAPKTEKGITGDLIKVNLKNGINQLLPEPVEKIQEVEEVIEETVEEELVALEDSVETINYIGEEVVETIEYVEEYIEEVVEEPVYETPSNRIYCKFEVSFYTTAPDEGSGTGIGASGEYVQPWVSIALPSDIPFYSTAYIEGLGTFYNHDTGSYIQWAYDVEGNLVCRVDVCVSSKEEAYSLGRFVADGYIDLAQ